MNLRPNPGRQGFFTAIHGFENRAATVLLLLLVLLPLAEIAVRWVIKSGIPAQADYLRHLVVWVGCAGAMIASRESGHLSGGLLTMTRENTRPRVRTFNALVSAAVASYCAAAALLFVLQGFDGSQTVGIIPVRAATAILPLCFAVMATRFVAKAPAAWGKVVASLGLLTAALPLTGWSVSLSAPAWLPWAVVVLLAGCALAGTSLFIALSGIAAVLLAHQGGAAPVLMDQVYTTLTGSLIPALPLFTFAGFVLSESGARLRLVALFEAWAGWLPGGAVLTVILSSAFFTSFTGATGVTILALGAVLLSLFPKESASGRTIGLITASSSLGLLLVPSLPVIIYGSIAHVNIRDLFACGAAPNALLCALVALTAFLWRSPKPGRQRGFNIAAALAAGGNAWWEALLPVMVMVAFFSGFATLIECGALACLWTMAGGMVVHRDVNVRSLAATAQKSLPVIGGVLVLLCAASGVSYCMIDAEAPARLAAWMRDHVESRIVFLLMLNAALIVVGCVMDMYAALVVVAPLCIPLGAVYGVDPLHLGVIFIANLGIGFLTPPVGLSVLLASNRFNIPLRRVVWHTLPYFAALLLGLLVITFLPGVVLWPLGRP